ncbi:MAG: type II toxin-antitoxin system prevent-host-death family antitoxin [Mycobacteriaceae bacterium]
MSEHHISLAEARKQFGELLAQVDYTGDRIVVTKHGKPRAALVSMEDLVRLRDEAPAKTAEPAPPAQPSTESATLVATRAQVWDALTELRTRSAWWLDVFFDPGVDGEFIQYWPDAKGRERILAGRVSEFVADERFQVRWDDDTCSTVELKGEDGAIVVTVTHGGGAPPTGWLLNLQDLHDWLATRS